MLATHFSEETRLERVRSMKLLSGESVRLLNIYYSFLLFFLSFFLSLSIVGLPSFSVAVL